MRGFSFASVILSYFLVGGGMFTGSLAAGVLAIDVELIGYAFLAAGALVGGFVAARASRGQTILEPAIGAIAVVATIVALAAGTATGQLIWAIAKDQTMRFVGAVGVSSVVGAIVGAFLSEKLLGEATRSSVPWIIYSAFATFGASILATIVAVMLIAGDRLHLQSFDQLGAAILIGIGAGCFVAGLAVGASARTRPLLAALLGGGAGVAGFFLLLTRASVREHQDQATGLAVLAAGGAITTLIGTALGWALVGRRNADA